jgi:lipopolysaccharide transport system permease protein
MPDRLSARSRKAASGVIELVARPISMMIRYRVILWAMVGRSLRERVSGSVFGFVFLLLYPLLFLGVYSVVFIAILKIRIPEFSPESYSTMIFCGLVPFLAFSEAFSLGTASAVTNAALIRNIVFPYELIPLKDVAASYLAMSVGMLLIWAAAIATSGFAATQLLLPVIYMMQAAFTAGLVWVTATVNVFFRDLSKIMPIILLLLMVLSPIGYTESMVPSGLLPWLSLNPLAAFIFTYRHILIDHVIPYDTIARLLAATVLLFCFGFLFMHRLRPMVADHV